MEDRDMRARQELALLVRAAIHRVIDEIAAYAAVVEQRIALRGRAVADDRLASSLGFDEELEQLAFGALHPLRKAQIGAQLGEAEARFLLEELANACGGRLGLVFRTRGVDAQRPAVGRQLFDVEQLQALTR